MNFSYKIYTIRKIKMNNNPSEETVKIILKNDLTKNRSNEVLEDITSYQKYIIYMNNDLQKDNRLYILKCKELESRIEELEDDNESMEKGRVYIKGLLTNFHEMNKWYKSINKHQTQVLNSTRRFVTDYKNNYIWKLRIVQLLFFCIVLTVYFFLNISYSTIIMFTTPVLVLISFHENYYCNLVLPSFSTHENSIKDILCQIKKTEASQDYIYEFIDQQ